MLENLTPRTRTALSKIDHIRAALEPKDQKLFDEYIRDVHNWTANGLALALSTQGIHISGDTIRRYRLRHGYC